MLEPIEKLRNRVLGVAEEDGDPQADHFRTLRFFTAELLVTAGVQASLRLFRDRTRDGHARHEQQDTDAPTPLELAPALLGPAAAAVQAIRAVRPSENAETATRVMNALVIAAGAAGLAETASRAIRGEGRFSFNPLLFGYIGVLGLLLDREEADVREQTEQLRRRASLVERWVPKRKTRVKGIVVHV
jgi:hypothetical protein